MVAVLPRGELQVHCETRSPSACRCSISVALWASTIAAQPREMGLSWTSGSRAFGLLRPRAPNKLGQYYCNNRHYDINQGRWISPDQASSPFYDLFDYVSAAIVQRTDSSGLGITVKVASLNDPKLNPDFSDDAVEKAAIKLAGGNASRSPTQFFNIIYSAWLQCIASGKSAGECCVDKIVRYGHSSAGFGGGHGSVLGASADPVTGVVTTEERPWGYLSTSQATFLQRIMCKDASIVNWTCYGLDIGWDSWADPFYGLIELLLYSGGEYHGFQSMCWFNNTEQGRVP